MIAIVDYGAGNLTSVQRAFETLQAPVEITRSPQRIRQAERVVFPGVGAAQAAMDTLRSRGLDAAIRAVVEAGTPFLGICLGTQIVFERSEENGGVDTLGLMAGTVRRFQPSRPFDKVPHMGWNRVQWTGPHPVTQGLEDGSEFYFVHSYYPVPKVDALALGRTEYADAVFASAVARANVVATQFHPEKSGRIGLRLLENFCQWNGRAPC